MKTKLLLLASLILISGTNAICAQQAPTGDDRTKQELLDLSKSKWQWMADKNIDQLDALFHENSVFVHMGATMSKEQELGTIRSGGIHYKHADIQETTIRFVGDNTAVILDRLRLTAVVGGNEVVNPFTVTEVYVRIDGRWKLGSLSFTRMSGE